AVPAPEHDNAPAPAPEFVRSTPRHTIQILIDLIRRVPPAFPIGVGPVTAILLAVAPERAAQTVLLQHPLDGALPNDALGVVAHHDVTAAGGCDELLECGLAAPAAAPVAPAIGVLDQARLPAQRYIAVVPAAREQLRDVVVAGILPGVVRRVPGEQGERAAR